MNRKGPWEGCPSRLPLRAPFQRDVWVRGRPGYVLVVRHTDRCICLCCDSGAEGSSVCDKEGVEDLGMV